MLHAVLQIGWYDSFKILKNACFSKAFYIILYLKFFKVRLSPFKILVLLRLRKSQNALQFSLFFFFLFLWQPYQGLRNWKSIFLILKIWHYGRLGRWYLHFYKTYDQQIKQTGTSTGFNSNETNQAGAGDVITSKSRDKLKTLLNTYLY